MYGGRASRPLPAPSFQDGSPPWKRPEVHFQLGLYPPVQPAVPLRVGSLVSPSDPPLPWIANLCRDGSCGATPAARRSAHGEVGEAPRRRCNALSLTQVKETGQGGRGGLDPRNCGAEGSLLQHRERTRPPNRFPRLTVWWGIPIVPECPTVPADGGSPGRKGDRT
jgi:hypothetical protein